MKVYVDKLPKNCKECPLSEFETVDYYTDCYICKLTKGEVKNKNYCPLKTIEEYDKELLKKADIVGFTKIEYLEQKLKDEQDHKQIIVDAYTKRINELQEQLKNAIVPKFEAGQQVYITLNGKIYKEEYVGENKEETITFERMYCGCCADEWHTYKNEFVFATQAEAEQRLKELKGENKSEK